MFLHSHVLFFLSFSAPCPRSSGGREASAFKGLRKVLTKSSSWTLATHRDSRRSRTRPSESSSRQSAGRHGRHGLWSSCGRLWVSPRAESRTTEGTTSARRCADHARCVDRWPDGRNGCTTGERDATQCIRLTSLEPDDHVLKPRYFRVKVFKPTHFTVILTCVKMIRVAWFSMVFTAPPSQNLRQPHLLLG